MCEKILSKLISTNIEPSFLKKFFLIPAILFLLIACPLTLCSCSGANNAAADIAAAKEAEPAAKEAVQEKRIEKFGHLRPEINLSSGTIDLKQFNREVNDGYFYFHGYTTIYRAYDYYRETQDLFARIYVQVKVSKTTGEATVIKFE